MIRKTYLLIIPVFIILVLNMGCSGSNSPVAPSDDSPVSASAETNNEILYSGRMIIPQDFTGEIKSIEDKETMLNMNITGYLASWCPGGCFTFQIFDVVGTVLHIELEIENPTALQAYDVRLIYIGLYGKQVLNPDSYTDLFVKPGIRPFTAFAKENPDRNFPVSPDAFDTELLLLDIPPGAPGYVDYMITASFPNQTYEPYEINSMYAGMGLTPSGGSAEIGCYVLDHQDDVNSVIIDTTVLTGAVTNLIQDTGDYTHWSATISNTEGAAIGDYTLIIQANSPNDEFIHTYNFVTVTVYEDSGEYNGYEHPGLFIGEDDRIHIAFVRRSMTDDSLQLCYTVSDNGGVSFRTPSVVLTVQANDTIMDTPVAAFDEFGWNNVVIIYNLNGDICAALSNDDGITFQTGFLISEDGTENHQPDFVLDSNNDCVFTWTYIDALYGGDVYYRKTEIIGAGGQLDMAFLIEPTDLEHNYWSLGKKEFSPAICIQDDDTYMIANVIEAYANDGFDTVQTLDSPDGLTWTFERGMIGTGGFSDVTKVTADYGDNESYAYYGSPSTTSRNFVTKMNMPDYEYSWFETPFTNNNEILSSHATGHIFLFADGNNILQIRKSNVANEIDNGWSVLNPEVSDTDPRISHVRSAGDDSLGYMYLAYFRVDGSGIKLLKSTDTSGDSWDEHEVWMQ